MDMGYCGFEKIFQSPRSFLTNEELVLFLKEYRADLGRETQGSEGIKEPEAN